MDGWMFNFNLQLTSLPIRKMLAPYLLFVAYLNLQMMHNTQSPQVAIPKQKQANVQPWLYSSKIKKILVQTHQDCRIPTGQSID